MDNYFDEDSPSGRHSEIQKTAMTRIVHPHLVSVRTMMMAMMVKVIASRR